jgi:hypothetical protein
LVQDGGASFWIKFESAWYRSLFICCSESGSGLQIEIWTRDLPNTKHRRCPHANMSSCTIEKNQNGGRSECSCRRGGYSW